ncbi:MAG: UbiA family prenyltransferase [Deltaproteobacteria bacterium]|jgi:1,4-dihydroxy-2-naphthoate octaprenyltransferase|nr:UbiA family prenyltransferase [Deltaproteobacteria bacterium]
MSEDDLHDRDGHDANEEHDASEGQETNVGLETNEGAPPAAQEDLQGAVGQEEGDAAPRPAEEAADTAEAPAQTEAVSAEDAARTEADSAEDGVQTEVDTAEDASEGIGKDADKAASDVGEAIADAPKERKLDVHWAPFSEEEGSADAPMDSEDKALGMADDDESLGDSQPKDDTPPFPTLEKTPSQAPSKHGEQILESVKAWIQASRPSYFMVTLFPLLLGYIAADRVSLHSRPGMFVLILIASVLVHAAANMCNDYFEDQSGVDTRDSLGGSRVIQEGLLTAEDLKRGIIVCYLVAFILAIFIAGMHPTLWVMILFAFFSSVFYVAPPVKYGHRALGELMVFLNMGVIMVVGTFIALTGKCDKNVVALSLPPAFMVAAILYFQSLPEIDRDKEVGKLTLAGILGKEAAALVYLLWWPFVWFLILFLYLTGHLGGVALFSLIAIPLHVVMVMRIYQSNDWVSLDHSGWIVKVIYLITALAMLFGAAFAPESHSLALPATAPAVPVTPPVPVVTGPL